MRVLSESEAKNRMVELLFSFDAFCKKNDITYCLGYGALLGCIRHKGFIPWDNDIDLFIFRDQAEKLWNLMNEESDDYKIVVKYFENTKIISRIYFVDKKTYGENVYENMGIYVEGFVIDYRSDNVLIDYYEQVIQKILYIKNLPHSEDQNHIKRFLKNCMITHFRPLNFSRAEDRLYRNLSMRMKKKDGKRVYIQTNPYKKKYYKAEWFDEYTDGQYENGYVPIPLKYDEILKYIYGDYMVPTPPSKRNKEMQKFFLLD